MRFWLVCLALIFTGCTSTQVTLTPTLRGPIVPTRVIPTDTPTLTPTSTLTYTATFTSSPVPTDTPVNTATPAPTATPVNTSTPIPSATPLNTLTPTFTDTPAPTLTPTFAPTSTLVPTNEPSPSAEATAEQPAVLYRNSTSLEPQFIRDTVMLDTPISGTIDDQHPAELYSFDASAGQVLDVSMTKASGDLDAYLLILDPKGREIARDDNADSNSDDAAVHVLNIPETGTYVILATRYGQAFGSTSGDFDLNVSAVLTSESPLGEFTQATGYDTLVNGTLNDDTPQLDYTFRATAGDVITLEMAASSGDLDPNLTLTDNLGTQLAYNDDNLATGALDAIIQNYIIPKSGYYTVIAGRYTGGSNSGDYRLKLAKTSQNTTALYALIDPINSSTLADDGTQYLNFSMGDLIDDNKQEHTLQTLLTFRLPPSRDRQVQSATFQMQPCQEIGGGFGTLGQLTIYQDDFGKFNQNHNLTHPLPGARVLSVQNTCDALDLINEVKAVYAAGRTELRLRLVFRNHTNNGVEDEVQITPNLLINFGS